jgi:hypothetical protein
MNICCSSVKERKVGEIEIEILAAFLEAVGMGFEERTVRS